MSHRYDFKTNLIDYICSGHSLLSVKTTEKNRLIGIIKNCADDINRKVYIWSAAIGWHTIDGKNVGGDSDSKEPEVALQQILKLDESSVLILKDFEFYMSSNTYSKCDIVNSWIQELNKYLCNTKQTIVFLGAEFHLPPSLKDAITFIEFKLPDDSHIEKLIRFVSEGVEKKDGSKFELDIKVLPDLITACRGMTEAQIVDRTSLALRQNKDLNNDAVCSILNEKANIIQNSNLLTFHGIPETKLNSVGGYDVLKKHIELDKPCFTDEARQFGIEPPKGILMVGIPGSGKTLLSKCIAADLNVPLISMDVANIMDSLVGGSESNMREAIRLLESIAPCVLQLDEIEKGFGGSGDLDGGSSRRVFGQFLKWLSNKNSFVYVVATANNVASLPSEFLRKGRFDELFGLDLPSEQERMQIFDIHISKRGRNPKDFDIKKLSSITSEYSGADIEEVVKMGLKIAFSVKQELNNNHLLCAALEIVPLAKIEPERIENLRNWMLKRVKLANPKISSTNNKRTINV